MGCVVFPDAIPDSLEQGVKGPGFPVEVYNVLGAGDAFMSGFLRGWLRDEPLETCCAYANANGAFAVSRLLCSAEYPTWAELSRFLKRGSPHRALRRDEALNHIHWATTRRPEPPAIMALAIDHRAQLEKIADAAGSPRQRISDFKLLAVEAAAKVAAGRPGYGMLLDGKYGHEALFRAVDHGFWIGRPVEEPGSRPLEFELGGSLGVKLIEWPVAHTIKCLCFYHPDDPPEMKTRQERELLRLNDAARTLERELLIEIIVSKHGPVDDRTTARVLDRLYEIGVKPDWWKLEGQASKTAWDNIAHAIEIGDPLCRGVLLLGLEAPEKDLAEAFALARNCSVVKGFAVGRTIFAEPATDWFAGRIDDRQAVDCMMAAFGRLCALWTKTVEQAREARRPADA
jgi:5-dehydro-2-deoxygluconokinase